ncbi:unnamed protein product [Allacma fusca]|uniref:Uncharacterized protein n=1 Tax=Allacma fusca TaxID=39272 RepID=A0A8J2P5H4_9HEXA|nr:unnamed protein product [Allacma fusca]
MPSNNILLFLLLSFLAVILAAPTNPSVESDNEHVSEENRSDSDGADDGIESYEWDEFEKGLLEAMTRSRWTRFRDRVTKLARERLAAEAARRAAGALFG